MARAILNFRIILLITFINIVLLANSEISYAKTMYWQSQVSSDGREVGPVNLTKGVTYSVEVQGSFYMGKWSQNGRSIVNDPCYEFVAHPSPTPIPVLQNNLGINWCSSYRPGHVYESAPFISDGKPLWFRIYDSYYQDNRGWLVAVVYQYPPGSNKEELIQPDNQGEGHSHTLTCPPGTKESSYDSSRCYVLSTLSPYGMTNCSGQYAGFELSAGGRCVQYINKQ